MASLSQIARIEEARVRRVARASAKQVEIEWFIGKATRTIQLTMKRRVRLATQLLQSRVVQNLSVPVGRGVGGQIVQRSKPGEFPRAETVQLMRTIFTDFQSDETGVSGHVCTPLDYGLLLELKMQRPFLVRTLMEEKRKITKLLASEIQITKTF